MTMTPADHPHLRPVPPTAAAAALEEVLADEEVAEKVWDGITPPRNRHVGPRFLTDVIVELGHASRERVDEAIEAARAVVHALAQAGVAVKVWNRTPERARSLAADLGAEAVQDLPPADLLVQCTSIGLADTSSPFKDLPLTVDSLDGYACVVDLVYRAGGTELLREAQRRGSRVIDGLAILVHQGALSFERWTGRPAPLEVMHEATRDPASHDDDPTRPPAPAPGPADRGGRGAG